MEIVINTNNIFVDVIEKLLNKKGSNIFYEKVLGKSDLDSIMITLFDLVNNEQKENVELFIVDKYFSNTNDEYLCKLAEAFDVYKVKKVEILTLKMNSCCESQMKEILAQSKNREIKISKMSKKQEQDIHDRFWFVKLEDIVFCVSVGTSFNGLGKKICLAQKISDEDNKELIRILKDDYGIEV